MKTTYQPVDSEGFTSYYQDYCFERTKLYTTANYLNALALNINLLENQPGARCSRWLMPVMMLDKSFTQSKQLTAIKQRIY